MRDDQILDLADLAEGQWGLLTSAQASEAGVSAQQLKRMTDRYLLIRIRHGVYRLAGAPESPDDDIRAEWLALDPKRTAAERLHETPVGVVSHRSAARLLDLGDIDADLHEFTVPRRKGTRNQEVRFHIDSLERGDWQLVNGLPVTRPLRTVIDLASVRTDGGHLASVMRDALFSGDAPRIEFEAALRPYAHFYGAPLGDGAGLVERFLAEAGVPEMVIHAPAARAVATMPVPTVVAGQALSRTITTPELANMRNIAESVFQNSKAFEDIAKHLANQTELYEKLLQVLSPAANAALSKLTADLPKLDLAPGNTEALQRAVAAALQSNDRALSTGPDPDEHEEDL